MDEMIEVFIEWPKGLEEFGIMLLPKFARNAASD